MLLLIYGIISANTVSASFIPDIVGSYVLQLAVSDGTSTSTDNVVILVDEAVSVTLVPDSISIPRGGNLGYTVTVKNNTNTTRTFKYWTYVKLPNSSRYPATGELFGPVSVTLNPGQSKNAHLTHSIPTIAPLGTYTYHGQVGTYPAIWDSSSFNFTVTITTAPVPQGRTSDTWELLENGLK